MKKVSGDRKFLIFNGVISFVGLLIRLIAGFQLFQFESRVANPPKVTDMWTYLHLSGEILSGSPPREFYYQPFYYSVFLPVVRFFCRDSVLPVIFAQSICGAVSIYLAGLIAARIAGKKAGLIAAGLLAFSQICIVYTPYALLEIMQSFWFILLLYLTFIAWSQNKLWQWLLTGVVLSFAILSRGNAWIFLPAVFLAVWFASRKKEHRKRVTAIACGVVLLGTILPQLPFVIVNSVERGSLQGPSTAGGNVLALGNTPEAPPGGLVYPESYQLWMDKEKEVSIARRMFDWAKEEPLAFLELQFRKVYLFWNHGEIPNNISPKEAVEKAPVLNAFHFIPTGFIMIAALSGIFMGLRRMFKGKERLFIASSFIVLYCLAMAAFYNLARFRVPCVPLMCVLGGCGIMFLIFKFKAKENKPKNIFIALFVLLLSWFIVYPGYNYYRTFYEPIIMRTVRPYGVNVPNRKGGRLIYDHGPRVLGGWLPFSTPLLHKKFKLKEELAPGTPVTVSVAVVAMGDRPVITVNGIGVDLSAIKQRSIEMVHLPVPYPGDGIFRFSFTENLSPVLDIQRSYGRTYDRKGIPMNEEMVVSLSTNGPQQ
ncbi:MAG: glycosyltransferase family 39 protein [Lentisphaeria bacterium]|nr:glycosyltransferase family 39 protein [Lentisphaeria bacterium]